MSFTFNEELVLSDNPVIEKELTKIDTQKLIHCIKEVALNSVTLSGLKKEFGIFKKDGSALIEGEHIKNYFVIVLDGIKRVWKKMVNEYEGLQSFQKEPLYENIFTYFDELVDKVNFDDLFKKELKSINEC